jgi:hypothetical protein
VRFLHRRLARDRIAADEAGGSMTSQTILALLFTLLAATVQWGIFFWFLPL